VLTALLLAMLGVFCLGFGVVLLRRGESIAELPEREVLLSRREDTADPRVIRRRGAVFVVLGVLGIALAILAAIGAS